MKHLSSGQISKVVAGAGAGIPEVDHIQNCPLCASEVQSSRDVLFHFRNSIRDWSESQEHLEMSFAERAALGAHSSRNQRHSPLLWVVTAAALATIVAIPVYQRSRDHEIELQAERDAQLMDDVQSHLSQSTPAAMDPLMQLMSSPDNSGRDLANQK